MCMGGNELPPHLDNMGRLSDKLADLIQRMKESDERLEQLINKHVDDTNAHCEELRRLTNED